MFKFTLAGREFVWPKITTRVLTRLRDDYKLDLRGLLKSDSSEVAAALMDDEVVMGAFKGLCKDQIEASGIDSDAILDGWDEVVNVSARESLIESFFTFSRGPKAAKEAMRRMRDTGETAPT